MYITIDIALMHWDFFEDVRIWEKKRVLCGKGLDHSSSRLLNACAIVVIIFDK